MKFCGKFLVFLAVYVPWVSATTQYCHNATGMCYWKETEPRNWTDARKVCQSQGGDLAVIETQELLDFVITLYHSRFHWVGLSDEAQENDFRWLNNAPLYYSYWMYGSPRARPSENCLISRGPIMQQGCDLTYPALCSSIADNCTNEKDGCVSVPAAALGPLTGPHGPADWYTALNLCKGRGQRLLTIDSQEEKDNITALIDGVLYRDIWLGLSDEAVESVFRTPEGFITSWTNWRGQRPNGDAQDPAGNQDCVKRLWTDGGWDDADCTDSCKFYCEGTPRNVWMNGIEDEAGVLIDGDENSCAKLTEVKHCSPPDQMVVKVEIENKEVSVVVSTKMTPCTADYLTVMWKSVAGKYKRCIMNAMETVAGDTFTCNYVCDVTGDVAMEIKMEAVKMAIDGVAVCEVLVC